MVTDIQPARSSRVRRVRVPCRVLSVEEDNVCCYLQHHALIAYSGILLGLLSVRAKMAALGTVSEAKSHVLLSTNPSLRIAAITLNLVALVLLIVTIPLTGTKAHWELDYDGERRKPRIHHTAHDTGASSPFVQGDHCIKQQSLIVHT